jgi:hypothetical protein
MTTRFISTPYLPAFFASAFHCLGRIKPSDCADSASCQQNENGTFAPDAFVRPKVGPTKARLSHSQRQRSLTGAFAVP